jgi:hypothetical protein
VCPCQCTCQLPAPVVIGWLGSCGETTCLYCRVEVSESDIGCALRNASWCGALVSRAFTETTTSGESTTTLIVVGPAWFISTRGPLTVGTPSLHAWTLVYRESHFVLMILLELSCIPACTLWRICREKCVSEKLVATINGPQGATWLDCCSYAFMISPPVFRGCLWQPPCLHPQYTRYYRRPACTMRQSIPMSFLPQGLLTVSLSPAFLGDHDACLASATLPPLFEFELENDS